MRGGLPLYPRSAKRRKRKYTKLGLRILQSGMAVSVLIMYTSNQIGSTYGEYNTSQEQITSIGLCSVFPGQIEQLLSEFSGHVRTIIELKSSLGSHIPSGNYTTPRSLKNCQRRNWIRSPVRSQNKSGWQAIQLTHWIHS